MIRRAFTMRLKPNASTEYRHHHDNVWPELVKEIERSGIASITTFQRDLDLFLVSEIHNEQAWDRLWNSEVHRKWAEVMEPLMNLRDDGIVDAGELTEIFHLETSRGSKPPKRSARGRRSAKKKKTATKKTVTKKASAGGAKKRTGQAKKKSASKKSSRRR